MDIAKNYRISIYNSRTGINIYPSFDFRKRIRDNYERNLIRARWRESNIIEPLSMMARSDRRGARIILLEIPFTCKMAAVVCSWHAPPPTLSPPFPSSPSPSSTLSRRPPLAKAALPFPRRWWRSVATPVSSVKRPNSLPPPHAHYTGPCFSRRNES